MVEDITRATITTIARVVRVDVQIVLYLNGHTIAIILSNTTSTMMHLLIFSTGNDSFNTAKEFAVQVRYSSGQNSWHNTKDIYINLMQRVTLSATARTFRYCKAVLLSPTLKSTIRVRILPKMPQVQMIGQMAQYRTVFRISREWESLLIFLVHELFSTNMLVTFSTKVIVT